MIKYKQLFRHDPENRIFGDCYRTCIACLLDMKPEQVPNFAEEHWKDGEAWEKAVQEWLEPRGYKLIHFGYVYENLQDLMTLLGHSFKDTFYLLHGMSKNKTNHVVIGMGDKIYWDPSLDDTGIIGPLVEIEEQNIYQTSILISTRFCNIPKQIYNPADYQCKHNVPYKYACPDCDKEEELE